MRGLSWDARLLLAASVGIVLFAVGSVLFGPADPAPKLSVRSADPDGALALRLWLEAENHHVHEVLANPIKLEQTDILFILEPIIPYDEGEITYLLDWVHSGGTLILAGSAWLLNPLLEPVDLLLDRRFSATQPVAQAAPLLLAPPVDALQAEPTYTIDIGNANAVIRLNLGEEPVLVSLPWGDGMIWVSGAIRPFTNRGLQEAGHARLVSNMLPGRELRIGFDEARHGFGSGQISFGSWLLTSPPGLGLLGAIGLTVVFLALRGRHFGTPIPLPADRLRREPIEYIEAIAGLLRRAGQRPAILEHFNQRLRRRLAERYGIPARADARTIAQAVHARDPAIDTDALADLLKRLEARDITEAELVETAGHVSDWMRTLR